MERGSRDMRRQKGKRNVVVCDCFAGRLWWIEWTGFCKDLPDMESDKVTVIETLVL